MQLIGHLPRAEEESKQYYQEIKENWYQFQTLGRSRNAEEGFQKRQYADIHVVKTEHKGLGLRAATSLKKDDFVYEYVGDVVNETVLRKRMREYAEEGIQHFYFMMLQREQYIDATKRGGKGRFANHSCNPNCFVAKWVVGKRIRMGIFAKRDIRENEELTFNYNVDRYGHDAQKCYCEEPNCVGFLGGKTQTDVRADEMIDALGIPDTKARGRDVLKVAITDPRPIAAAEASIFINAIRQMSNDRTCTVALLKRISMSESEALRELMRFRCFGMISGILEDNYTEDNIDREIVELILRSWQDWPLMNRGKIIQSGIEEKLAVIAAGEDEELKDLANQLLTKWATLEESGYRIPKRKNEDVLLEVEESRSKRLTASQSPPHDDLEEPQPVLKFKATPLLGGGAHRRIGPLPPQPDPALNGHTNGTPEPPVARRPTKSELDAIIARAAEFSLPVSSPGGSSIALPTPTSEGTPKTSDRGMRGRDWSKCTPDMREKRMKKLVGDVVVKTLSKWRRELSHEQFKSTAKDLTDKIAETEMRGKNLSNSKFEKLSDEKVEKVKKFVKLSAAKILARQKKRQDSYGTPQDGGTDTPSGVDFSTPNFTDVNTALTTPFGTGSATPYDSTPDAPSSSLGDMHLNRVHG